jgi:hypothetical protein
MKNFKLLLASLAFVLFGVINASAQTTTRYYTYDGAASTHPNFMFDVQNGSNPDFLAVSGNWDLLTGQDEPTCDNPETRLCAIKVEFTSGNPSAQGIFDAVKAKLIERLATVPVALTFFNGYSFGAVVDGVSVTITILTKEDPI